MSQGLAVADDTASRETRDRELFDRIASEYCKKDLHASASVARRHRSRRTIRVVPEDARARILDVGCGCGFSARQIAGEYESYLGIDYSSRLIEYANEHNAGESVAFEVANIKTFEAGEPFDVVFMIGVLHHIPERVYPYMVN